MTKRLTFTEKAIVRAVTAARKAGVEVGAVTVAPDGTITIQSAHDEMRMGKDRSPTASKWET